MQSARPNGKSDLTTALSALLKFRRSLHEGKECEFSEEEKKLAHRVARVRIAEGGDYNLSGERYKDTILEVHKDWQNVDLGEVAEIVSGQSPEGKYYNDKGEGLPFYQGKSDFGDIYLRNPTNWTNQITKIAEKDDILISVRAPVGPVNLAPFKICIGRGLASIRPQKGLNYLFLFYVLRESQDKIKSYGSGSTFEAINREQITKIKIPLPPLSVQQEIVAEIEGYQKIIDGARQVVENYKPRIKVDEGWEVVELGEIFDKITDSIDPKKNNGNVKYIGLENIESGTCGLIGDFNKEISEIKSTKLVFVKHDILYGKLRPNLNKVWLAESEGICSTDFLVLRAKNENAIPKFYSFILRDSDFNTQVLKGIKGAQLPRVGYEYISKIKVPLPPISIQKDIILCIEEEQKLVEANKRLMKIFKEKIKYKIAEVWG